jgi:hypothetical protein
VLAATRVRTAVIAAALLPGLACVGIAVATPGPLVLHVTGMVVRGDRVTAITVQATNRTGAPVTPHFYVDARSHLKSPWLIAAGPRRIAPGESSTVTLRPGFLGAPRKGALRVWALSDGPPAFSSVPLPRCPPTSCAHS